MARDFRFGLAISNGFGDDPVKAALEAKASGFDVAVIGDHIGPEFAPMPALAAIAASTTSIRLGTNLHQRRSRDGTAVPCIGGD